MNCFAQDQSLSDLLYSNSNSKGGRQSTFKGNSALLHSDVIDFALLPTQRLIGGKQFYC